MSALTIDQARVVDRLREAAKEHGEVATALAFIASARVSVPAGGSAEEHAERLQYLNAIRAAAAFAALDRGEGT